MTRPRLTARPWTWKNPDGSTTPGIALMNGRYVKAHLTPDQARRFADRIHELTDAAGNPEPVIESTPLESE